MKQIYNNSLQHSGLKDLEDAELELVALFGERFLEYRKNWQLAGIFEYEPEFPLYIMLEQTYKCNLQCVSCIHGYPDSRKQYDMGISCMPRKLYNRIVLEAEEYGCPSISMHCNDEPLLVKDLSKRIAFARKHGFMDIIMTTNGLLFREEKIEEIIDAGITRILFSIDALSEKTYKQVRPGGDLRKVLLALELIKKNRQKRGSKLPILRASFVPCALNEHELEPFLKNYSAIVDYVEIQPFCSYYDTNINLVSKKSRQISDFFCSQPWTRLIVRGNGDVLPCCSFYGGQLIVGNVYNNTLKQIFGSDLLKQLRNEFKSGYYRNAACIACSRSIYETSVRGN